MCDEKTKNIFCDNCQDNFFCEMPEDYNCNKNCNTCRHLVNCHNVSFIDMFYIAYAYYNGHTVEEQKHIDKFEYPYCKWISEQFIQYQEILKQKFQNYNPRNFMDYLYKLKEKK